MDRLANDPTAAQGDGAAEDAGTRDPSAVQIADVARRLAPRAYAVLVRNPAVDPDLPDSADIDVLAFTDADDLYPERVFDREPPGARRPVDVTWLPVSWLEAPEEFAARGLVAHRLATSDVVIARTDDIARRCAAARAAFDALPMRERRIAGFLEMGFLTVREIGITWDFPALALFWLHMAYAACIAAALDGKRQTCPNVFTRPLDHVADPAARAFWAETLCLDAELPALVAAVRRVHAAVRARFPEPASSSSLRRSTRLEYRYWIRAEELDWRIRAAEEMCRRGRNASAIFYLRFHVYALARVPMVHAAAREDRDVSFLRPERAVLPELHRLCPEIVDDVNVALGAPRSSSVERVHRALAAVVTLRDETIETLRERGLTIPHPPPWVPHRGQRRAVERGEPCRT